MDLYEELGLTSNATLNDVKQRYRELAQIHHPDKGGNEERFKRISLAYEILSDPIRRKNYDENKTVNDGSNIRQDAINQLSIVFFTLIQNFNCVDGNLVETLKSETRKLQSMATYDLNLCNHFIHNLEIAKQKLKVKDVHKDNVLTSFLETQLNIRQKEKLMFEFRIKLTDEMLNILENYTYGFLEIPSN